MKRDADGTGLPTGPAEARSVGQVFRLILALKQGRYHGPYRAGVGGSVGVAAGLPVDRAHVQAGAAADAIQRLLELRAQQFGTAVVHEDEVQLLRAVELARLPGPRDEVGVDRELLSRAAAGQEPDEDRKVLEAGNKLLYPHHDDVHRGNAGDEPGVSLVGNRGHGARLGHPEVGARDADIGGQELLAQAPAGKRPQGLDVGRQLLARGPGEDLRYAFAVHVQDGAHDVRGRVARELRDPLPKVRLHDLQVEVGVVLFEALVELDLLGRHALGLGDDLRALSAGEVAYVADDVFSIRRKEDVAAARLHGVGHLFQVAVEVGHRLLLYAVSPLPELRRLGQGVQNRVAPGDGFVGKKLDGVVELLVRDGPAGPVVKALDPAPYALIAAVVGLAFAGRLSGFQGVNQPFRRRAPARDGARGCRGPFSSGGLPGASGNWSRRR